MNVPCFPHTICVISWLSAYWKDSIVNIDIEDPMSNPFNITDGEQPVPSHRFNDFNEKTYYCYCSTRSICYLMTSQ